MNRKLRMGMVGGGPGAFIGGVHRAAARLDGKIDLVCGAFSTKPENNKAMAAELFLPEEKCYNSYQEMFEKESQLPVGERIDFVAVTTPNSTHFPIAMAALGAPPAPAKVAKAFTSIKIGRQRPTPVSALVPVSGICPI